MDKEGGAKNLNTTRRLTTISLVLLFGLFLAYSPSLAHPPSKMELSYDGGNRILQVKVAHRVGNPSSHYVESIKISKNGELVLEKDYDKQENRSESIYEFDLEANNGDSIKVEAECNRFGKISKSLKIEGLPAVGEVLLRAQLTTASEVPPVKGETPSSAAGLAVILLDREDNVLHYAITYKGLSGTPTMAHFHRAEKGESGPPVRTIFGKPEIEGALADPPEGNSAFVSGEWTGEGEQPLTEELEEAILAGQIYINIHTELNPAGEIRAQMLQAD